MPWAPVPNGWLRLRHDYSFGTPLRRPDEARRAQTDSHAREPLMAPPRRSANSGLTESFGG